MTDRELRLRTRIDQLSDERDLYRERWEAARGRGVRWRIRLVAMRKSRDKWKALAQERRSPNAVRCARYQDRLREAA